MSNHSFAEYGYYVRKPSSTPLLYANNAPASAGESRDTVNNLAHIADQSGQVWACDGLVSGRYTDTDYVPGGSPVGMTRPAHMARVICKHVRTRPSSSAVTGASLADGGPFKLRVRVGGATNGVAGTATFYAIMGPSGDDPISGAAATRALVLAGGGTARSNETIGSTVTSTEAWLTMSSNVISLSAGALASCARSVPTYAYDAAGTLIAASQTVYTVAVDIFGWATTNNVGPRLYGLYVAEWVG